MTLQPPARLAAPWYVHPLEEPDAWRRLQAHRELAFAVVNVRNGFADDDEAYREVLEAPFATPLLGYVDTSYGERTEAEILAEAERWLALPSVRGILLDQVPSQLRQRNWQLGTIDRLRELGAETVAANPGVLPDPHLIETADVTCVMENNWLEFLHWQPSPSLLGTDPDRVWMLLHGVPKAEQTTALAVCAERGAGLAWVTAGRLPNPWATLPAGWAGSARATMRV
ncbi:spherulation-specific family 4 protein [Leucobacter sp. USHLN153]|uniref:spherulation-specific family 4 protein n=1 Tax=Leucobacter sp. USHLN153 TaxID=3081268 RepID=UPI0030183F87